jgi:16S rRNA (adenine(1408)-N(1))-methyltransferase
MPWSTKQSLTVLSGRSSEELDPEAFATDLGRYPRILVDLGTGDGRYALSAARDDPDAFVIGIDPVAEAMAESARKVRRKPARGGLANVRFVIASLEQLPEALEGVADEVTVNFPWGSLLLAVGWPQMDGLRRVVDVLKPGGRLVALLNASAAEKIDHAARLNLPPLEDPSHVSEKLVPAWEKAGLLAVHAKFLEGFDQPVARTTWGQRLIRGSGRTTLYVEGTRRAD